MVFVVAVSAVPADEGSIFEDLRVVTRGPRAFLGVHLSEETDHAEGGARITKIVRGTAADDAGLQSGDIIVGIDRSTVRGPGGVIHRLNEAQPGERVVVHYLRDDVEETVQVRLGEKPGGISVQMDESFHVVAPNTRGAIRGTMTLDEDDRLDEIFVCHGEECKFSFDDPMWYRLDCVEQRCPTYRVSYFGRPMLGVEVTEITRELQQHFGGDAGTGVLISNVYPGSPAELAGIETGDMIIAVDGRQVGEPGDIRDAIEDNEGEYLDIEVVRDRRSMTLEAEIPEFVND